MGLGRAHYGRAVWPQAVGIAVERQLRAHISKPKQEAESTSERAGVLCKLTACPQ